MIDNIIGTRDFDGGTVALEGYHPLRPYFLPVGNLGRIMTVVLRLTRKFCHRLQMILAVI